MTTATQAWVLLAIVLIFGFVMALVARSRFRTLLSEVSEYRERISILQLESSSSQGMLLAAEVAENANERLEEIRLKHASIANRLLDRIAGGLGEELSRRWRFCRPTGEREVEAKNRRAEPTP